MGYVGDTLDKLHISILILDFIKTKNILFRLSREIQRGKFAVVFFCCFVPSSPDRLPPLRPFWA